MKTVQADKRFVHITDCKITGLYQRIPKQFGGWKIDIMYQENENDIFPVFTSIEIDQRKFEKEFLEADFDKDKFRLCYTNGMTDIDIYKRGEDYIIYKSINDGHYVYFFFSAQEFNNIRNWLKLENKK